MRGPEPECDYAERNRSDIESCFKGLPGITVQCARDETVPPPCVQQTQTDVRRFEPTRRPTAKLFCEGYALSARRQNATFCKSAESRSKTRSRHAQTTCEHVGIHEGLASTGMFEDLT